MRQAHDRVPLMGHGAGVVLAYPQSPGQFIIVKVVLMALQYLQYVFATYPFHHPRGAGVTGFADHVVQVFLQGRVNVQRTFLGGNHGGEQNGDFRQAGGVEHMRTVERSQAVAAFLIHDYQGNRQAAVLYLPSQPCSSTNWFNAFCNLISCTGLRSCWTRSCALACGTNNSASNNRRQCRKIPDVLICEGSLPRSGPVVSG